ncbi:hypothetical protein BH23GEM7_BH23GEM7_39860 [soil metagenome]
MLRTARFLHRFLRPDPGRVRVKEARVTVGDRTVPATLYLPRRGRSLPGWVVLHGITVTGRHHPALTRFAQALAAAGAAALVPDIPEWRSLRITLDAAVATIKGGASFLEERPEVKAGGIGVAGFSFAATQALIAAAQPELRPDVATVAGFGGYADLHRTVQCMLTGEHEWQGVRYRLDPDPYGRWILGGNYLPLIRGYEGMTAVAAGLHGLAVEAGRRGVFAAEPEYDGLKADIRAGLAPEERRLWDVLAPPANRPPADLELARSLAGELADAALRAEPRGDLLRALPQLQCRVALAHGRGDRLIPFTETLRLLSLLPPQLAVYGTVIHSYAHSMEAERLRPLEYAREAYRFVRLLSYALDSV